MVLLEEKQHFRLVGTLIIQPYISYSSYSTFIVRPACGSINVVGLILILHSIGISIAGVSKNTSQYFLDMTLNLTL